MQSPKRKNKASVYRRLAGMTQSDVAKILKTGKSNIANMESEKHFPSEAYRKLLKVTPDELTSKAVAVTGSLNHKNVFQFCVTENPSQTQYKPLHNSKVSEELFESKDSLNSDAVLSPGGELDGTDVYIWKSEQDFLSLDIVKGSRIPVIPRTSYNDGDIILCRRTLTKFSVAKVSDGGTRLLSVEENEPHPDICTVDIIGEIIIK